METLINDLIQNFNSEKLIQLFRRLNRSFSAKEQQSYDDLFQNNNIRDYYSNIRQIGSGKIENDLHENRHEEDFIVVTAKSNQPLNIRSSKKRQFELGKRILENKFLPMGFFVFYDDAGNFRFSFITSKYLVNQEVQSHFRRYTYFVSNTQTNKTFRSRFEKADFNSLKSILEAFSLAPVTKEFYNQLQDWYFKTIERGIFPPDIEKDLNKKKEFVIRLITRLMFIWFMREKKLISPELFEPDSLRELIKDFGESNHYYWTILQNLFFATLSVPIKKRKFRREEVFQGKNKDYANPFVYRYHVYMKVPKALQKIFLEIPFLNGGLFECLDYIEDKKRIFIDGFTETSEENRPRLSDKLFFGEEGIIDIFKSYNFTIDENDPADVEVALDPELLGHVFENLLAVFNPESTDIARKNTGSFYTPRSIVDYMVNEALELYYKEGVSDESDKDLIKGLIRGRVEYEELTDALKRTIVERTNQLRIVDPAVGSGAFPMTILNKLVSILEQVDPGNELWKKEQEKVVRAVKDIKIRNELLKEIEVMFQRKNADFFRKLYLIQKIIYGVDIQNTAIEIAKLRFFLSLLVEEEINEKEENKGLIPLPNLDFKLMQGNSLLEQCCGINFEFEIPENGSIPQQKELFVTKEQELIGQILELKEKFAVEPEAHKKKKIREEINEKLIALTLEKLERIYIILQNSLNNQEKFVGFVEKLIPRLAGYLWKDKEKRHRVSEEKFSEAFEQLKKDVKHKLSVSLQERRPKDFFLWKIFFAEVFEEKGGFDIVIGNPPYIQLQKNHGELAELYKEAGYETFARTGDIYALFYERGLELTRENGFLVYITSNKWMRAGYGEKLRRFFVKKNPVKLVDLGGLKVFESATVDTNIFVVQNAPNQHFMEACRVTSDKFATDDDLAEYCDKHKIILRHLNEDPWFIGTKEEKKLKEKIEKIGTPLKDWNVNIYRGVLTGFNEAFIIDKETKEKLIAEDPKSAEIIKPLLRGRDIKRYGYEFAEKYLINTHNGYTDENVNKIPPINVENYPAIKKWLDQFYDKLAKRQDKGNTPYNLRDCAYLQEFEKEKVVYSEIVREPQFYYDENKFFVEATAFIMTGERIKMLTGVFNSKLFTFIFKTFYAGGGLGEDGYRYKKKFIEKVPIPKITPENKYIAEQIENLVDQILEAKKQNPSANTTELESQIDEFVYKLYGLTEQEKALVEAAVEKKKKIPEQENND